MLRAAVACALLSATAVVDTTPVVPEGLPGKLGDIMQLLYPGWRADDATAGVTDGGRPQHARLVDARALVLGTRKGVALLVKTWSGDACDAGVCPATTANLAVLLVDQGKIQLVALARAAVSCERCSLDAAARSYDRATPLVGVDEASGSPDEVRLQLFRLDKSTLAPVFTRRVQWETCRTEVVSDDVDTPPFPLRVTDRCRDGRTATEIWRWTSSRYQLHGPPSDADEPDSTLGSDEGAE